MKPDEALSFETADQLERWLERYHATERELWVRVFKKQSGTQTVTWDDCVIAAVAWGWIDGQRKSLDEVSYLQRLTPRRAKSNWSKRNRDLAERLIAEGRMRPSGLAHVEAARSDGRWEQAYSGSSEMVLPEDFLEELQKSPAAKRFFKTLDRRNHYAIYLRLHTATSSGLRKKRMADILAQLARGVSFR